MDIGHSLSFYRVIKHPFCAFQTFSTFKRFNRQPVHILIFFAMLKVQVNPFVNFFHVPFSSDLHVIKCAARNKFKILSSPGGYLNCKFKNFYNVFIVSKSGFTKHKKPFNLI